MNWNKIRTLATRPSSKNYAILRRKLPPAIEHQYFKGRQDTRFNQSKRTMLMLGAAVGSFGIFYIYHLEQVPGSKRSRFMTVSPKQELELSNGAFRELLNTYQGRILPQNSSQTRLIEKVAMRLIKASGFQDLYNWQVLVIDDPTRNAFVIPGGKIFVFTGILPIMQDEAGIATVLSHEISHVILRHSSERMSWANTLAMSRFLLIVLGIDVGPLLHGLIVNIGILLPFSRNCETEADYSGLLMMAKACYDPHAAVGLWQRMKASDGNKTPTYLSTHPTSNNRILKFQEWIPEAEAIKDSNCTSMSAFKGYYSNIN